MAEQLPTLCHVTWQATNMDRTQAFLEALFGWAFKPQGDNYMVFEPPSGAWVGLTEVRQVRTGTAFMPQISVPDLAACIERARRLGSSVVVEEGEMPGMGPYADMRDPDGALFSVLEFSDKRAKR